jgi:glycosyltransferase involved in cell wall biosynthesis
LLKSEDGRRMDEAHVLHDGDNGVWGVSLVICSHNGASRLSAVFAHLALQKVAPGLPWEVVLVDNASTDGTAAVANTYWPQDAPCPLRVVREELLGLTHARCRGLAEAKYEIVSFVDDDNWPAADWVQAAAAVMSGDERIGACGGLLDAAYEFPPPDWFHRVSEYCAIGGQGQRPGDLTWSRGYLWGAGLTVRKSAWRKLIADGFRFHLQDRKGAASTSGGDAELCLALRLAGWKLWYEPAMRMKHFIPARRMEWTYLEGIARGFGTAAVVLNAYATVPESGSRTVILRLRSSWLCQVMITALRLLASCGRCLLELPRWEGNQAVLEMMYRRQVLVELLQLRTAYDGLCRQVQHLWCRPRHGITNSLQVP